MTNQVLVGLVPSLIPAHRSCVLHSMVSVTYGERCITHGLILRGDVRSYLTRHLRCHMEVI